MRQGLPPISKEGPLKRKADPEVGLKSFGRGCLKGEVAYDGATTPWQLRVLHVIIPVVHALFASMPDTFAAKSVSSARFAPSDPLILGVRQAFDTFKAVSIRNYAVAQSCIHCDKQCVAISMFIKRCRSIIPNG